MWTPLWISHPEQRNWSDMDEPYATSIKGSEGICLQYTHVIAVSDGFLRPYDRNRQPNNTFGLVSSFNACVNQLVQR